MGIDIWPFQGSSFVTKGRGQLKNKSNGGSKLGRPGKGRGKGGGGGGAAETDPYFSYVTALLHMNGADASTTFTDEIGATWTANGSAQIDTDQFKFNDSSGLFSGGSDTVTTPSTSDWNLDFDDFTMEFWIRASSIGSASHILHKRLSGDNSNFWLLRIETDGRFHVAALTGGTTITNITSTAAITANTWHHCAVSRVTGHLCYVYVDGVGGQTEVANTTWSWPSTTHPVVIGGFETEAFSGHLAELRITRGVARYTENFTPPTAPFPDS